MNWRFDGMKNFLTRLGYKGDKSRGTEIDVTGVRILSEEEMSAVWVGDGFAKKLASIRADDALSQGLEFPNDKDGKFQKELKRLKVISKAKLALQWADLFGGCAILPMVSDGTADLAQPRADRRLAPVTDIRIYDRTRIWSISTLINNDPNSPFFENVEVFKIRKLDGTPFDVHSTRLIIIKGEPIPHNMHLNSIDLRWWGQSMLQPVFNDIAAYGTAFQGLTHLMGECSIAKYRFPNLEALLAEGPDGEAKIYNRMELINAGKSITRGVFLGEGEEYIRENIPIDGIAAAIQPFREHVSGVTGFPITRIWGTSPGGLNATGESDQNNHYDRIREYQETNVEPVLSDLFLRVARGMGLADNVAEFTFKALGAPTQAQLVEMRSKQATTDIAYITANVLTTDEVRKDRFFKRASLETVVDTEAAPEAEEPIAGAEDEPPPRKPR